MSDFRSNPGRSKTRVGELAGYDVRGMSKDLQRLRGKFTAPNARAKRCFRPLPGAGKNTSYKGDPK